MGKRLLWVSILLTGLMTVGLRLLISEKPIVSLPPFPNRYVDDLLFFGNLYDTCHERDFDKEKFLAQLKQNVPKFAAKKYSLGKQTLYDEKIQQTTQKTFMVSSGQILINQLTYNKEEFIDPRIAAVLIEMATTGLTRPGEDVAYPFGIQRYLGQNALNPANNQLYVLRTMDFVQAFLQARKSVKAGDESAAIEKYWYNNLLSIKDEFDKKRFVELYTSLFGVDPRRCAGQ